MQLVEQRERYYLKKLELLQLARSEQAALHAAKLEMLRAKTQYYQSRTSSQAQPAGTFVSFTQSAENGATGMHTHPPLVPTFFH